MDVSWERTRPYIDIDDRMIADLLRMAGVRGRIRHRAVIPKGLRNTNHVLVLDDDSRYLLRVYGTGDDACSREAAIHKHLPAVVGRPDLLNLCPPGALCGYAIALFEYIDGETLDNVSNPPERTYESIGEQLAILHDFKRYGSVGFLDGDLNVSVTLPPLHQWYGMFLTGAVTAKLGGDLADEVSVYLDRNRDAMDAMDSDSVLVHNDFRPINIMIAGNGRVIPIDWEGAMAGHALGDAGQFLRFREQVPEVCERRFVDAYNATSTRPLPVEYRFLGRLRDLVNLLQMLGGETLPRRDGDLIGFIRQTVQA